MKAVASEAYKRYSENEDAPIAVYVEDQVTDGFDIFFENAMTRWQRSHGNLDEIVKNFGGVARCLRLLIENSRNYEALEDALAHPETDLIPSLIMAAFRKHIDELESP